MFRYGLTTADWNTLFESQGQTCAACDRTEPHSKHGWSTDHDHETEKVRGILCSRDNSTVGHVERALRSPKLRKYLEEVVGILLTKVEK